MFRRFLGAAVVALLLSPTAVPAAAGTHHAAAPHKLIVVVKKNLTPAAENRLAVLVLVNQSGNAPSAALATASKPLNVLLDNRRLYRVKAEINTSCTGSCSGTLRISGSTNHKLQVVPSCQPRGSGFVCSKVTIVKLY